VDNLFRHRRRSGKMKMLRTISLGSGVSVQGLMVGQLADGKIVIKAKDKTFVGCPAGGPQAF